MKKTITSPDHTQICYELSGKGDAALLFVHGWLGNKSWWNPQRDFFSNKYQIAQMDLAGHGESGKTRTGWSSSAYAQDIIAVAADLPAKNIILVGHSMSGIYASEAALSIPNIKALIIVDTLKDLDQMMTIEQASPIFDVYRKDFKNAVENIIPQYLFVNDTPPEIKSQLQKEFLTHSGDFAATCIAPFYKTDVREFAHKLSIPVRAINSDVGPTNLEGNRKYYKDFDYAIIEKVGHYPMLERPAKFNTTLEHTLNSLL